MRRRRSTGPPVHSRRNGRRMAMDVTCETKSASNEVIKWSNRLSADSLSRANLLNIGEVRFDWQSWRNQSKLKNPEAMLLSRDITSTLTVKAPIVLFCGPAVIIDTSIARITIIDWPSGSCGGAGARSGCKLTNLLLRHTHSPLLKTLKHCM